MLNLRDDLDVLVETVAAEPCRCTPARIGAGAVCGPCQARRVREWLDVTGVRLRRWRNGIGGAPLLRIRHVAGPVEVAREGRRSCPGYIVDRWQLCTRCGVELAHGKWAVFLEPGSYVSQVRDAAGLEHHAQPWRDGMSGADCDTQEVASELRNSIERAMIGAMSIAGNRTGQVPYGWRRLAGGQLEVDAQAYSVRVGVMHLLRSGYTLDRIAVVLNSAGAPLEKNNGVWTKRHVQRIVETRIDDALLNSLLPADRDMLDSIIEAAEELPEKRIRRPRRTRQKNTSVA